jgi:hypothetical protein
MAAATGRKMNVVNRTLFFARFSAGHLAPSRTATETCDFAALLDPNACPASGAAPNVTIKLSRTTLGAMKPSRVFPTPAQLSPAIHKRNTVESASASAAAGRLIRAVPKADTATPVPPTTSVQDLGRVRSDGDGPLPELASTPTTDMAGALPDPETIAPTSFSVPTSGTCPTDQIPTSTFMGLGVFGHHGAVAGGAVDTPLGITTKLSGVIPAELAPSALGTSPSAGSFDDVTRAVASYSTMGPALIAGKVDFSRLSVAPGAPERSRPSLLLDPTRLNMSGNLPEKSASRLQSARRAPLPTMVGGEDFNNPSIVVTGDEALQVVVRSDSRTPAERSRLLRQLTGVAAEFGVDIHELTLDGSVESVVANYRGGSDGRSAH